MTDILLVDGCGATRVIELPDDELPKVFHHRHENRENRITKDLPHVIDFAPSGEIDPFGRTVYRQIGMGTPKMRFHILKQKPTLRIEGSTGE